MLKYRGNRISKENHVSFKRIALVVLCALMVVSFLTNCAGTKEAVEEEPAPAKVATAEKPAEPAKVEKKIPEWVAKVTDAEVMVGSRAASIPKAYESYSLMLRAPEMGAFELFLVEKGILQEKDLYMALAEKFRIPFADLRQQKGSKKALSLLPTELIKKLNVLPLSVEGDTMIVATLLPDPNPICEVILRHSPVHNVDFVLVQPSHLRNVLKMLFQKKQS